MRDFAELLVSWCMRDIEAGLVKTKPQAEQPGVLPRKHTDNVRAVGSVTQSTRKSSAIAEARALHGET
jgi:hypothetical protein